MMRGYGTCLGNPGTFLIIHSRCPVFVFGIITCLSRPCCLLGLCISAIVGGFAAFLLGFRIIGRLTFSHRLAF